MPAYNSNQEALLMPEYGRMVQSMVQAAMEIPDKATRQQCARYIVSIMARMQDVKSERPDFEHKLWNHLARISHYQLDIDYPVDIVPEQEALAHPAPMAYPMKSIRRRHYGYLTEQMMNYLSECEDEEERTELYEGLQDIIDEKGSDYQSIYNYINKNKTYRNLAEGKSIEEMAYYALTHKSSSCYYFAAFTYLLMKQAGYEVSFVRGLGWQNGTEHCWIMFKDTDGWYFMDSLYVRSAKLTTKQCKEIGYKWNPTIHPEAK